MEVKMQINQLKKSYSEKTVVDGVSFSIPKGKILSLIGPNGAGKSTVMGLISRLILRDSGEIDFDGRDIAKWKSRDLSKRLAILTQSNNISAKLTVRELVTFGRFPYSGSHVTPEDKVIIDRAITYMELTQMENSFLDELSGGQRQLAYIAMVIAQDTEYILLDEPTNNLDIYHATNMMKIVRRLCDELGKTVILVLHEINYAAFYSDYICALVDGKIAKFGTVKEIMTKENLREIYHVDFEVIEINGKPLSIYY
jgi:iron complex transport system ATP-binding protein